MRKQEKTYRKDRVPKPEGKKEGRNKTILKTKLDLKTVSCLINHQSIHPSIKSDSDLIIGANIKGPRPLPKRKNKK